MLRIFAAAGVLVGLGLVAGCADDTPSTPATPEQSTSAAAQTPSSEVAAAGDPAQPCALLPAETVGEQFDISEVTAEPLPEQAAENGAKVYICQYTADAAGTELGALTVSVHEGNQITAPAMIDALKGSYSAPQDVPGVGEAAATFEDEDSRYLAAAKVVSGTPVMVMYIGAKTATVDILTALVQPAVDQL